MVVQVEGSGGGRVLKRRVKSNETFWMYKIYMYSVTVLAY